MNDQELKPIHEAILRCTRRFDDGEWWDTSEIDQKITQLVEWKQAEVVVDTMVESMTGDKIIRLKGPGHVYQTRKEYFDN